jgi:hypothetical protein
MAKSAIHNTNIEARSQYLGISRRFLLDLNMVLLVAILGMKGASFTGRLMLRERYRKPFNGLLLQRVHFCFSREIRSRLQTKVNPRPISNDSP